MRGLILTGWSFASSLVILIYSDFRDWPMKATWAIFFLNLILNCILTPFALTALGIHN